MSTFETVVLGVGDAFSERYRPTSLLLSYDDFFLAIDCPDMYRSVLKEASAISGRQLSLSAIDHVLITHVHGDHMNGLEGVGFYKRYAEGKNRGASRSLLERAADVVIKERRPLILVHREMPISAIHLEHMLKLAQYGATIMPASPGFYHQPQTIADIIDFVVARILDHLDIEHSLVERWGETTPK